MKKFHSIINRSNRQPGFTLVEILIAVTIFAIMSVIALTGITSVTDSREAIRHAADQLGELQTTLYYLEQDLHYLADRDIRDEFGDTHIALEAGNTGISELQLTRSGLRNPQQLKRSQLIRVRYLLNEGKLVRSRFVNLDRAIEAPTLDRTLLNNVDAFELRFMDSDAQWQDFWPPLAATGPVGLPRAIEIRLQHKQMGDIIRLIELPG